MTHFLHRSPHIYAYMLHASGHIFNSCPNTTAPMSFSPQDGATADIEKGSLHFLHSVFGDNNN